MPNICFNHITMSKKDFARTKHLLINEDGQIDFSILIPHSVRAKADNYYQWNCLTNNVLTDQELNKAILSAKTIADLPEQFFADHYGDMLLLREKFGWTKQDGGYEWQISHWGTKWGNGDIDPDITEIDEDTIMISFDTAWSPPEPIYYALAKHTDFNVDGIEEMGGFEYDGYATDGDFHIDYEDVPEEEYED